MDLPGGYEIFDLMNNAKSRRPLMQGLRLAVSHAFQLMVKVRPPMAQHASGMVRD